jgi:hypothetical protein
LGHTVGAINKGQAVPEDCGRTQEISLTEWRKTEITHRHLPMMYLVKLRKNRLGNTTAALRNMLTKGLQRITDRVCPQQRKNTVCIEHNIGFHMGVFF